MTVLELSISITSSYQKVYELTADKVKHALESLETGNLPKARVVDLLHDAHESAYKFADSVINVNKFTGNKELIDEITTKFLDPALRMHDNIFDKYYVYTKENGYGA